MLEWIGIKGSNNISLVNVLSNKIHLMSSPFSEMLMVIKELMFSSILS
jgi:hypothetical protein